MLLHSLHFPTGGQCLLTHEAAEGWLSATWTGYIGTPEAMQGAADYLAHVGPFHCLYLLNDNLALRGPWFNSVEWLEQAWLGQAERLGLRYVAHVVQSDAHADILTLSRLDLPECELEIQLFYDRPAAESWLRSCQQPPVRGNPGPPRL